MSTEFELFSVCLAQVERKTRDNFLNDPCRQGSMTMDFNIWVARSADRIVVVDTGFSPSAGERRGRDLRWRPAEAIQALGIDASTVTDLVITHMHYDHAGNINDFPNAKIWVQKSELAYVAGPSMRHKTLNHFFEAEDVQAMVSANFEGRVAQVDGDHVLTEGIELYHVGGHTPGLQMLRVKTQRGWVVLASDALHYYENFETKNPFPGIVNVPDMMDGYEKIMALAKDPSFIIPGHDPQVRKEYPDATGGKYEGILALHEQPIGK